MNPVYSSGLQGINNAVLRMNAASSNVSRSILTDAKAVKIENNEPRLTEDTIDLSTEAVEMIKSEVQLKASASVVRSFDETQQALVDILA